MAGRLPGCLLDCLFHGRDICLLDYLVLDQDAGLEAYLDGGLNASLLGRLHTPGPRPLPGHLPASWPARLHRPWPTSLSWRLPACMLNFFIHA